jgi:hypothetical protein
MLIILDGAVVLLDTTLAVQVRRTVVFLRAKNVEEICRGKEGCWNVGKVDCKFGVE